LRLKLFSPKAEKFSTRAGKFSPDAEKFSPSELNVLARMSVLARSMTADAGDKTVGSGLHTGCQTDGERRTDANPALPPHVAAEGGAHVQKNTILPIFSGCP